MPQKLILDDWQKIVLETKGNICLCTGRQVGKSTVIAIRAGEFAINNKNKSIMVIAATERQALLLFEKILGYIHDNYKSHIKEGRDKLGQRVAPTKHKITLKNGSTINCLPTGQTGYGIRGYTIDDLYADEAHFIPEDVWAAVTPMLATTGGRINLLSTPDLSKGKDGYFYRCFHDSEHFTSFNVSSMEVAEKRKEPMRTQMLDFFKAEKKRMSTREFAAEYNGSFIDTMFQFFPNDWIDKVCCLDKNDINLDKHLFKERTLGVDVGGMGGDQSTFETFGRYSKKIHQLGHEVALNIRTTEIVQRVLMLDNDFKYKQRESIGIDDAGIGAGVFDQLLIHPQTKRKVIGLNNAQKDIQDNRRTKLLKEDMYNNLLGMGERDEIRLFNDDEIKASLRSIVIDPDSPTFRLTGRYSHITEGIVRAVYLLRGKPLNIWLETIKL